jgi:arylsulfatase A-like enzyme
VPVPAAVQGHSLRALFHGEKASWRDEWFYEHHYAHGGKIPESEGVRTPRWKYIRYTSATPAVEELYDLQRDPLETRNLVRSPEHTNRLAVLRLRWTQLRDELR